MIRDPTATRADNDDEMPFDEADVEISLPKHNPSQPVVLSEYNEHVWAVVTPNSQEDMELTFQGTHAVSNNGQSSIEFPENVSATTTGKMLIPLAHFYSDKSEFGRTLAAARHDHPLAVSPAINFGALDYVALVFKGQEVKDRHVTLRCYRPRKEQKAPAATPLVQQQQLHPQGGPQLYRTAQTQQPLHPYTAAMAQGQYNPQVQQSPQVYQPPQVHQPYQVAPPQQQQQAAAQGQAAQMYPPQYAGVPMYPQYAAQPFRPPLPFSQGQYYTTYPPMPPAASGQPQQPMYLPPPQQSQRAFAPMGQPSAQAIATAQQQQQQQQR